MVLRKQNKNVNKKKDYEDTNKAINNRQRVRCLDSIGTR